ncbi:AraC family transcriptional regulator [Flavilitoribacter nigricans]|uniref:AraC family transcriptional regulator n=1 Tax=Flavilitoribacter nigricans (strain ATCC 23147 / DSM 23189 / NBRC 102662 / NCIMB 1420 / SS-2) TaxID=1122177 RepID=A0A2D0NC15_FLAN2|nr:AraC family transcriptional regulator [Flavilitoribacter nigricans]PHN06052.1 AraC family transcriptional regulator [Flavilitoribacter nigricans DSM 23189 = NBRC 102662]
MKAAFESIPKASDASFLAYRREEPEFAFNWHYHPEVELTYIRQGSGTRLVGDRLSEFGAGDLVLLGPNLPHTWATRNPVDGTERLASAIVIQFNAGLLGNGSDQLPEYQNLHRLLKKAGRGIYFPYEPASEIGAAMDDLLRFSGMQRLARLLLILDRLATIPEFTLLASPLYAPSYSRENEARLDRIFQLLHREFTRPISLQEVAKLAHMTESSCSRFFKKMVGRSLSDYLTDLRIARACQLLTETRKNISEIAFAAGFNSTTHFNRMFLRKKGMAPREYRKP